MKQENKIKKKQAPCTFKQPSDIPDLYLNHMAFINTAMLLIFPCALIYCVLIYCVCMFYLGNTVS